MTTKKDNGRSARPLRGDEAHILALIQQIYGDQNDVSKCFTSDQDEMVIFVKDQRRQSPIMVNLTFVADVAREQNLSDQVIKDNWLKPH